ncbi:hypothetical protein BT96DRAFT_372124 [Gymnopus androsaceus JB14]|uniref:Uncharacterized protein n=1 Tax=Gymnopus androsaceus JB14 TaxID=1447944 RepID=A0A6A4IK86_9AGAR|nr:hypothetical protein BT96DRAFT_372124 [Gymnopus androsaceus JB14]
MCLKALSGCPQTISIANATQFIAELQDIYVQARFLVFSQGSQHLRLLKLAKNAHIIPTSSMFTANAVPWPNL